MSESADKNLLARLAGGQADTSGSDPWSSLAATEPEHEAPAADSAKPDDLDALLSRINQLGEQKAEGQGDAQVPLPGDEAPADDEFVPIEPASFREAQLTDSEVEALILKYLLARGDVTGRDIAAQVRLPFMLIDELLRSMKADQLVVHRASAPMNDYQYQLSDVGRERARRYVSECCYFGAAPVSLSDYIDSVTAQSLADQKPTEEALGHAFKDLLLNRRMFDRLGPAINSGRGLFLYGYPGNGKTSIAERVTAAFGETIWIPRAIGVSGEILRLYDPMNHEEIPLESCEGLLDHRKIDQRWIKIRRPTIIAGGELTMEALEVTGNAATGISESPLQLKSNCGTLVIDDFGRQRMSVDKLLNRWIVPLEKRYDFLNLPNGTKIKVPFDQLIVFSTNLEPRDLVDEAFLRRIPYKIEAIDPTEEEFRDLFKIMAKNMGFPYNESAIDYLIAEHYKKVDRPLRFCQPRDLLLQVKNFCAYRNRPLELTPEYFDLAADIYFAVM